MSSPRYHARRSLGSKETFFLRICSLSPRLSLDLIESRVRMGESQEYRQLFVPITWRNG
jgi:hypothetical protein